MRKKGWWGMGLIVVVVILVGGYWWWKKDNLSPVGIADLRPVLNLEKYDFDSLRTRQKLRISGEQEEKLEILREIPEIEQRRKVVNAGKERKFAFRTAEIRFKSDGKWVSGMINYFPEKSSLSPVIIMVRGYAEKIGYYPGSGSWRVADELAKNGYATISLDFLGYGHSEMESSDMLEARFHKVVEVLDLLKTIKSLPWVDKNKIGFWAHSNGGQIVLSVLEITGERYPTVMWAPMTQPFPESVLSTIDEGSPVEAAIKEFSQHYDTRRYAFENYYGWINSPILIQQGTVDNQVKVEWQQEVIKNLGRKDSELMVYEGADHNLAGSWLEAVGDDLIFFQKNLK